MLCVSTVLGSVTESLLREIVAMCNERERLQNGLLVAQEAIAARDRRIRELEEGEKAE